MPWAPVFWVFWDSSVFLLTVKEQTRKMWIHCWNNCRSADADADEADAFLTWRQDSGRTVITGSGKGLSQGSLEKNFDPERFMELSGIYVKDAEGAGWGHCEIAAYYVWKVMEIMRGPWWLEKGKCCTLFLKTQEGLSRELSLTFSH